MRASILLAVCLFLSMSISGHRRELDDQKALDYCLKHHDTYIVVLWPVAEKTYSVELIEKKLASIAPILYKKEFKLTRSGQLMFIRQVYSNQQTRIGTYHDNFTLAQQKRKNAFGKGSRLRIYLVRTDNFPQLVAFKRDIRSQFRLNLMHIHDTHEECAKLARIVFSPPTITFLNSHHPRYFERFENLLQEFKATLDEYNLDYHSYCLVGDAVLAAYGIKECDALSFVREGGEDLQFSGKNGMYQTDHSDAHLLLHDPHHHFYYADLKFAHPVDLYKGKLPE